MADDQAGAGIFFVRGLQDVSIFTYLREFKVSILLDAGLESPEAEAVCPPPRIRRKGMVMVETLKLLQTSAATWGYPEHAYALHVASELRKYEQRTLAFVKKAIADVLFQAVMGRFSSDDAQV